MFREPSKLLIAIAVACAGIACAADGGTPDGGSLIDADQYRGLAADRRAYRVGDTLTVLVVESARAESRAGTERRRNVKVDARANDTANAVDLGIALAGQDDGTGGTRRSGDLRAQLAVRVIGLEVNGQLRVRGEQSIEVNGEVQRIAITGLVRTDDIAADNTVVSSRLSEAAIEFTGRGEVSATQGRSLTTRIMNWLGLL